MADPSNILTKPSFVSGIDGTIGEVLYSAPAGTEWYRPGSKSGSTEIKSMHLEKQSDGTFIGYESGNSNSVIVMNAAEAERFYKTEGLNYANDPAWIPTIPPTAPASITPAQQRIVTQSLTPSAATNGSVSTALSTAPAGTDWYRPGQQGNGANTPSIHLKKQSDGTFLAYEAGKPGQVLNASEAEQFYKTEGLGYSNTPEYLPKAPTETPVGQKTVEGTKGAPTAPEEKPTAPAAVEAESDETDIIVAQTVQGSFDQANFGAYSDWRVRLALAPGANYMYAGPNPGIMQPLQATNGVIFPYTPKITVSYAANYDASELTHSNYKIFQYSNSSIDSVTLTCDFTAQDVYEARYLLAVIHFFRSMTKMFYGQDMYPIRGTPPPLCYMFGLGGYQFAAHPLVINNFNYNLPDDVDYIKTTAPDPTNGAGGDWLERLAGVDIVTQIQQDRLGDKVSTGGIPPPPKFNNVPKDITTWVPTKIQMTIGCYPMISRNQVSNYFSLNDYASGKLVKGTTRPGGGMW